MNEKAIDAIVIDFSGAGQKGPVYGRTKRSRWGGGKTRYEAVIREDEDQGTVFATFERNTPEEATEALKEGMRFQMGYIEKKKAEPILVPDNDESPDVQMVLKESRATGRSKEIHASWSVGDRIRAAMKELDLDIDPVEDAIKRGKLKKVLLGEAIDKFVKNGIRRATYEPLMPKRTQKNSAKDCLHMLVEKFGGKTPLLYLAEDEGRDLLIDFYRDEIVKAGSLKYTRKYRRAFRGYARRFFIFCEDVYHIRLPFLMLEEKAEGEDSPVVVPKIRVIWTFMYKIITEHPQLLPFVILQLYYALRSEEAFRALQNPMQYIIDNRFWYPSRTGRTARAKALTKLTRNVRIRPLTWFLLSLVAGLLDRSITDFRVPVRRVVKKGPHKSRTGYRDVEQMQNQVNQLLRDSGFEWKGQMPKNILRKINLSAQYACKVPLERIAQEASHAKLDSLLDYIDQSWTEDEGLSFWSMVFFDDQPQPDPDLFVRYHAYEQLRPAPENEPHFKKQTDPKTGYKPRANRRQTP